MVLTLSLLLVEPLGIEVSSLVALLTDKTGICCDSTRLTGASGGADAYRVSLFGTDTVNDINWGYGLTPS